MSEATKRTGKTLGQVAWEAHPEVLRSGQRWSNKSRHIRSCWEEVAVAVVQAFLSDKAQAVDTNPSLGCTDP